jgi:hypothetical protein
MDPKKSFRISIVVLIISIILGIGAVARYISLQG